MKIALVGYEVQLQHVAATQEDEDSLLHSLLSQKGLNVHREIWDDPTVRWEDYGLLLIKSTWDYYEKISAFYQWLDKIAALGIPMLNPYSIIKWNSDKHYLQEMAAAGFNVIPSAIIENGAASALAPFFSQFNTQQLIIKPCVSGGARNTFTVTPHNLPELQPRIDALVQEEAYLVQPFIKEIETAGEWSFIFFNGTLNHCVVKRPRSGDFRVQLAHGGTVHIETPDPSHVKSAAAFVEKFAKDCLYARVDAVIINNKFTLMELELIEPYLFLGTVPGGYESYYTALINRIPQQQDTLAKPSSINIQ
jgi:glutathione synthase/RimK-type ligase-like ATP-grasp enzyme